MPDNRYQVTEILNAIEQDGHYFGFIQLEHAGKKQCFRIGINADDYLALKRTLQLRPFDQMAGLPHRYFYIPGGKRHDDKWATVAIKVEQDRSTKQVDMEWPLDLAKNLMWFWQLKDWSEAKHLEVASPNEGHTYLGYRKSIFELLNGLAELDNQYGPIELVCCWFDDFYVPAGNPAGYNRGVFERGLMEWKACFSDLELEVLAVFHKVFDKEHQNLSMEQPIKWRLDKNWQKVSKAAKEALSKMSI